MHMTRAKAFNAVLFHSAHLVMNPDQFLQFRLSIPDLHVTLRA